MIVLPAVDILDGKVVQLVGGRPGTERVVLPDPLAVARRWERAGAPGLHVVDLDGALGKGSNLEMVKTIVKEVSIPVQVGGGIRTTEIVDTLIDLGAARVILGTRAITEPQWLKVVSVRNPGRTVLALDVRQGLVQLEGWRESSNRKIEELLEEIRNVPLASVLHTNVDVEGRGAGIDAGEMSGFIRSCPHPVIASGGIKNMDDIILLSDLGAHMAIVGMALYTGSIDPKEIWGEKHESKNG